MLVCNISQGPVDQTGQEVMCNGSDAVFWSSSLLITGSSSDAIVKLTSASDVVIFAGASVCTAGVVLDGTTATLISEGTSSFTATAYSAAGVECDSGSNVTLQSVSGGSFLVRGGTNAPGIGPAGGKRCLSIEISNCSVDATGGTGIGAGRSMGGGQTDVANVTFRDCEVRANSSSHGSGIGSGYAYASATSSVGNITIMNATVHSSSSSFGSGIGSAYANCSGASSIGNLLIMNAIVNSSSSSFGSGIGSAYANSSGTSSIGNITIMNTVVHSVSLLFGCGMGSGYGTVNGVSCVANMGLINSTVNAASSSNGCGIGSGSGASSVESIGILNCTVRSMSSSEGCGIGTTSPSSSGDSTVRSLVIVGGTFECSGALGKPSIGSSDSGNVTISGVCFLVCKFEGVDGQGTEAHKPVDCRSIVLGDGALVFQTNAAQLFKFAPSRLGDLSLGIVYEIETSWGSEPLSNLSEILLHICNITLPKAESWKLCFAGPSGEQCFPRNVSHVKSLITTVSTRGNYSIFASSETVSGWLMPSEGEDNFEVLDDPASFSFAGFIPFRSPLPTTTPTASLTPLETSRPFTHTSQHDPSARPDRTAFYDRSGLAGRTHGFGRSSFNGVTKGYRSSFSFTHTQKFDDVSSLFCISKSFHGSAQRRSALHIDSSRLVATFSYRDSNTFGPSFSLVGTDDCNPSLCVAGSYSLVGTDECNPSLSVAGSFSLVATDDFSASLLVAESFSLVGTDDCNPSLSVAGSFSLVGTDDCTRLLSIAAPFGPISWSEFGFDGGGPGADSSSSSGRLAAIWWGVIAMGIAALVAAAVAVAMILLRKKPPPRMTESKSRDPSFDFTCDPTVLLD
jgi:hypothetical protein